ncbi:MAG TPA: hypothetical protein VGH43_03455 [Jatrophihabitans sp.]
MDLRRRRGRLHARPGNSSNLAEVYAVQPTRAFAFGKAPASHTTYQFA